MTHNAFGVIRAIVKDNMDVWTGDASLSFLDSDGQIGNANSRNLGGGAFGWSGGRRTLPTSCQPFPECSQDQRSPCCACHRL